MAFDPITAVIDLVKIGAEKFLPDKMSEVEKTSFEDNMARFVLEEGRKENSEFRTFVVEYEGAAKDVPRIVVIFRSLIRPLFTILIGYFDYLFFTGVTTAWHPEAIALLKAINIIVLVFWFGERAVQNTNLITLLSPKGPQK